MCPAGASVCLSDVQPRLGISAGRDNRKILMVPALGHQGRSDGGRVTCCVASAGPRFEADGASVFYCGGGASGKVRAVRKPKP